MPLAQKAYLIDLFGSLGLAWSEPARQVREFSRGDTVEKVRPAQWSVMRIRTEGEAQVMGSGRAIGGSPSEMNVVDA